MWVCNYCGSSEILQDAYVDPNDGSVVSTWDTYYCTICECNIKWVEEIKDSDDWENMEKINRGALAKKCMGCVLGGEFDDHDPNNCLKYAMTCEKDLQVMCMKCHEEFTKIEVTTADEFNK